MLGDPDFANRHGVVGMRARLPGYQETFLQMDMFLFGGKFQNHGLVWFHRNLVWLPVVGLGKRRVNGFFWLLACFEDMVAPAPGVNGRLPKNGACRGTPPNRVVATPLGLGESRRRPSILGGDPKPGPI